MNTSAAEQRGFSQGLRMNITRSIVVIKDFVLLVP